MSENMGIMEKIGRYRLTRRLGAGSFATVWQGHDDDLDVDVAVKVLADNWSDNADVRDRFLAEARIMRRVRDDRIVRVYDIGALPDGRPYFVMDYADGGSLDDLRRKGIPPKQALLLCAEASRALHELHANEVIHRDMTPGNILLHRTRDGGVKVLIADLGVAKSMVEMVGATMTAGTPAYMAREQATGVGVLDHRADIYSLAGVTYAMLTGRPPFPVRTLAELLARDPHEMPAPIAQRVGAPPLLDAVLEASLSPQPGRRPRSALEFAEVLEQCAAGMTDALATFGGTAPNFGAPTGHTPGGTPSSVINSGGNQVQAGVPHSVISSWPPRSSQPGQTDPGRAVPAQGFTGPPQIGFPQNQMSLPHSESHLQERGFPPPQPLSGHDEQPDATRSVLFWVLVLVAAIALFTIALLVTIKALS
ncbi:MAG: protein kinase [Propionibacteriales bacterium]|nr:protein kinase [Propionibacteriales bacterium]